MAKKIILRTLFVLLAIVGVFCAIVAMQPADFTITRKATLAAPPEKVFNQVNDFSKWQAWSPWIKQYPDTKVTLEGTQSGQGAVYKWKGDGAGEGVMTLTESKPHELVKIDLDFVKPMTAKNKTEFTFKPVGNAGGQTEVTWTMSGSNNFLGKAFALVMNIDKMVGGDFESGLKNMKEIVEVSK